MKGLVSFLVMIQATYAYSGLIYVDDFAPEASSWHAPDWILPTVVCFLMWSLIEKGMDRDKTTSRRIVGIVSIIVWLVWVSNL